MNLILKTAGVWMVAVALARGAAAADGHMHDHVAADATNGVDQAQAALRAQRIELMTTELKLSHEQQARIRTILDEQDQAMSRHRADMSARRDALTALVKAGDTAGQQKLRRELTEASNRQIEVYRTYSQAIFDVLTPEQQQAWRVLTAYQSIVNGRFRGCDLSDDQKAKVRALCARALADDASTNAVGAQARVDYTTLGADIERTILRPEQRDQALMNPVYSHVLRDLHGCSLTPEQDARVRSLCLEVAKAAQAKTLPEKGARRSSPITLAREVADTVKKTVLTPEQTVEMESNRVYESLIYAFRACEMTPDQDAHVRDLCRAAAAQFGASVDYTTRNDARRDIIEKVRATVLTDEQRAKMPAPRPPVQVLPVGGVTNGAAPVKAR